MFHLLPAVLLSAALLGPPPYPPPDPPSFDETAVESRITAATVFGSGAAVTRRAALPAGGGRFVLRGLAAAFDPDHLCARGEGGEIVGVEVRERLETGVSDERLGELRAKKRELDRAVAATRDELAVQNSMEEHVLRLLRLEEEAHGGDLRAARVETGVWEKNYEYLAGKLTLLRAAQRELGWRLEEQELERQNLLLELGRSEASAARTVRDVLVDVVDTSGRGGSLEVEYTVAEAGWTPLYDLRAKKDLSAVELVYRAQVRQSSGEDWRGVEVLLSTAQPQRGAQGPEPLPRWLSLVDPRARREAGRDSLRRMGYAESASAAPVLEAADAAEAPAAPPPFAEVSDEGLSLRYRLPRTETIESRDEPTAVLIGRESLEITPEHYCVPAIDPTVWLRAKAVNKSPWVLLPGRAAVYFGADFLGPADLATVQLGQEFTLHLGSDPGLVVKRTLLEDRREESGIFSSRQSRTEAWRIEVENHGAFSARPDGAVDLVVHESLPRPTDERIEVEIDRAEPALGEGERWQKLREETGALTWILHLPKAGKRTIELATTIAYPEDLELVGK
ncbi:MAG: DUF4139 domain-containing protein [Planctomycetota bacterium]